MKESTQYDHRLNLNLYVKDYATTVPQICYNSKNNILKNNHLVKKIEKIQMGPIQTNCEQDDQQIEIKLEMHMKRIIKFRIQPQHLKVIAQLIQTSKNMSQNYIYFKFEKTFLKYIENTYNFLYLMQINNFDPKAQQKDLKYQQINSLYQKINVQNLFDLSTQL
ncbi:unnamed protein product [Paramecium octaurelia]|uniref:Uncharacterized protein n=1 Tax=Paramecium octaurelia TaxID=43137 RepID=A0A8S1TC10_PAROT|nr:unnamed protein product [Paramecium octaurelia]